MGKAEENKKIKCNSLLSQSYKLFTTKGISDTSISDIVNSAGVAKGTFYFYFKDKQDIIDHLIDQKSEHLLKTASERLRSHVNANPQLPVEEKIIIIADSIISDLEKDPKLVKFLNRNLNFGFYVKAYQDENLIPGVPVKEAYDRIIRSNGDVWKNSELMLYTIIELISSSVHDIIISGTPCSLTTYKPYLFDSIRAIVETFRV
ncbi:MAG: TetR/AcrR family transcriptional regulator [Oscillospiraceae bacterium]|nr:TetR/AcrR family transcriptional regulator [Oscillospiraceae bacterium]